MWRTLRRPGLKQQASGQTVAQISREHGVSEATARAKYGGMQVSEVKRLPQNWCRDKKVIWHWIEPGKPTQNAYIERVNAGPPCGTFRREVLNANLFSSLAQVRRTRGRPCGGSLAGGVQYGTSPLGVKVYDTRRIPTGGLNSSQNWLIKRGKNR